MEDPSQQNMWRMSRLTVDIAMCGFLPNFAFHIDSDIYAGNNLLTFKTITSNGSL